MPNPLTGISDILSRLGYDRRLGPVGSVTLRQQEREFPETTGTLPGFPGFVQVPGKRDLTPEEVVHEGKHAEVGLPGAMAGTLANYAMGTTGDAYTTPDEALAFLSQPQSEATDVDMDNILSMVELNKMSTSANPLRRAYGSLLERRAREHKRPSQAYVAGLKGDR